MTLVPNVPLRLYAIPRSPISVVGAWEIDTDRAIMARE